MLTSNDFYKEVAEIKKTRDAEKDPYQKAMLTANLITLKLLLNLRTNSKRVMDHFKIEGIKSDRKEDEASVETTTAQGK